MARPKKTVQGTPNTEVEEQIFGDGANEALPVTGEETNDSFTEAVELPADQVYDPIPNHDSAVFGDGVRDIEQETAPEQTVNIPLSVLAQMQRSIADLEAARNGEEAINLLDVADKKKLINVTFYSVNLEDGTSKQLLVTGMLEKKFPNGTRSKVYSDGVDPETKRPIYKTVVELTDVETREVKPVEVIYENFIKLSTTVQKEAVKTNERLVDLTPDKNEVVEVTTYAENSSGYISQRGSGVLVKASVQGKVHDYDVEFNGQVFNLSSDVINIK